MPKNSMKQLNAMLCVSCSVNWIIWFKRRRKTKRMLLRTKWKVSRRCSGDFCRRMDRQSIGIASKSYRKMLLSSTTPSNSRRAMIRFAKCWTNLSLLSLMVAWGRRWDVMGRRVSFQCGMIWPSLTLPFNRLKWVVFWRRRIFFIYLSIFLFILESQ